MADSLSQIKTYETVDLDNFEIRGARSGINNARTTGPLYVGGVFDPIKSILTGSVVTTAGSDTITISSFDTPFSSLNAEDLVIGDSIIISSNTYSVIEILSTVSVKLDRPISSVGTTATFRLIDREYLIEPDVDANTDQVLASFDGTNVTGYGTSWLSDTTAGDVIQLNTLQQYFTINKVNSNTSLTISTPFPTDTTGNCTIKKWRLNWMDYEYTKNNFTYEKNYAKWKYDTTTGSDLTATSYWKTFVDGVELKFSPTLTPATAPDLMDSNLVKDKVLTKSTENPLFQYSLPVVPNPEESFTLSINGVPLDRFPDGNRDYVINYSQMPFYTFPPPIEERTVANIMFLSKISNTVLDPLETSSGTLIFRDGAGNQLAGIMPGSETILFDGSSQSINEDYVLNIDAGIGYASEHQTDEEVVKYVAYQKEGLYDHGLSITLNGVPQKLTIPHNDLDDVIFDTESGRMKPSDKDNPGPGEEYLVEYYTEGAYISGQTITVTPGSTSIRLPNKIKYQSLIITKNDAFLTEWEDYRVGYLTGRVVFFTPIVFGDLIVINYSPLEAHKNGFTYDEQGWSCKSYDVVATVSSTATLDFTLPYSDAINPSILSVYNVTKGLSYDVSGYILKDTLLHLQPTPNNIAIGTHLTDVIHVDYQVLSDSLEYKPVEVINFYIGQGSDYLAFVNQDLQSTFPTGSFIRLTNVDSIGDYFFRVSSTDYDGEDTVVNIEGNVPEDLTNPIIYVSDSVLNFTSAPLSANPFSSGTTKVIFPGTNYSANFRTGSLLNIKEDYYYINKAEYDSSAHQTIVSIALQSYSDYTNSGDLSAIRYSDCPLYYVGDTVISTARPFITDPATPAMSLNYNGLLTVTTDSSAIIVDKGSSQYSFSYASYPTVSSMATALATTGLQVVDYCPDWASSKIISVSDLTVTKDSSSVITIAPSLRYLGTDTSAYSFTNGLLTLLNPIKINDRYNLDYLGQKFLYDTTVSFSASYFSMLPAKSKVEASFRFDNLDQFYIQVTSQRSFLDDVIIPQMKQEALQQSGSIGQGGEISDDGDMQNSDGGLTGDEYRRKDMEIECRVFDNIFHYYNDRAQAFSDEMFAAKGWRLCNNDGLLSSTDESCGAKSISRLFPWADYTSFPPCPITPLTGQCIPNAVMGPSHPASSPKAKFTQGLATVTAVTTAGYPTRWLTQLKPGDYIRPYGTTNDYIISTINSDSNLTLTTTYSGATLKKSAFIMTSKYPLYNDDGHMGGKIIGTETSDFGLVDSDVFDVTVDGSHQSYTFQDPIDPFMALLYPVSSLSPSSIASLISSAFPRLNMTYEWAQDIDAPYGYKSVFVLRTEGTYNTMITGSGSAVEKLGFISDTTSIGNNNNTDSTPEYYLDNIEGSYLTNEASRLSTLIGYTNKMDRVLPAGVTMGNEIKSYAGDEYSIILSEMVKVSDQIVATSKIIMEPDRPSYSQTWSAFDSDTTFLADCSNASATDYPLALDFQGKGTVYKWLLNITQQPNKIIQGKDSTGMGVPTSTGSGITSIVGERTFFIHEDGDGTNDRRILNATVDSVNYVPIVKFSDNLAVADGTFNGTWDSLGGNQYSSIANDATFVLNDSVPSFYLRKIPEVFYAKADSTSMTLFWHGNTRSKEYLYSTYPTVGLLKSGLNRLAGIDATGNISYNSRPSSGILTFSSSALNLTISDSLYSLFQLNANGVYNISYGITKTAMNLSWDGSGKSYTYTNYPLVSSMKSGINADIPGLDATGSWIYDNTPVGFKTATTTAIPPDASVYPSLRNCFVEYYTLDSKTLKDRQGFITDRSSTLDDRINYLDTRETEIKGHIVSEEYFRSSDGSSGNLYSWADNRFNRSNGCEARLKQIEKQIEVNQASLGVSRRFL